MVTEKRKRGDLGEQIAVNYLIDSKYKILERNYQKKWGEIDIIAKKKKVIVFVEVKTRTKAPYSSFFPPEINVDYRKRQKMYRTIQTYLLNKKYPPEMDWQMDVIAIELDMKTKKADLKHIKAVF